MTDRTSETPAPTVTGEPIDLISQAKGRARFLRHRGEVKTPDIIERLLDKIGALNAEIIDLTLTQPTPSLQPDPGANESQGGVVVTGERDDLIAQLEGRARFCRDLGAVKSPDLMERAASALRQQAAEVEALQSQLAVVDQELREIDAGYGRVDAIRNLDALATKAEADLARMREALQAEHPCRHEWYQGQCVHCEIKVSAFRQAREEQGA